MTYNPAIPIGYDVDTDFTFAEILTVDDWLAREEERLLTDESLWRMANPHLGRIIELENYRQEARKAMADETTRREFLTKYLNIFQSGRTRDWVHPDTIRGLQTGERIDDLRGEDGWVCTVGFDFSMGDDLYAVSWLAVNTHSAPTRFFADCDAWVSDECTATSALRPLYQQWAAQGWMHIVPGEVFPTSLFLERIEAVAAKMDVMAFGYDPYRAKQPLNDLSAWLSGMGVDPKQTLMPVRQNFANTNPLVLEIDYLIKNDPALLRFSGSPLWPWEFGNAVLVESGDGMGNLRPLKASPSAKVDNVQALLNALYCYDILDGRTFDG